MIREFLSYRKPAKPYDLDMVVDRVAALRTFRVKELLVAKEKHYSQEKMSSARKHYAEQKNMEFEDSMKNFATDKVSGLLSEMVR